MRFGISYVNTAPHVGRDTALAMARTAERAGFESVWTVEHVVVPAGYESQYPYSRSGKMAGGADDFDIADPLVWLAFLAAATDRLRLATGVVILPQRNPLILAKAAATLDVLSGGRLIFGVGVGWLEEEFAALGIPFADRGRRTDEYVAALRTLWTEELASFDGEYVSFREVYLRPLPPQRPIPIVIGGHTPTAARRAGAIGDGFFPARGKPEQLQELFTVARRAAEDAGRDPAQLELTAGARPDPAYVEQLAEMGVTRVVTALPNLEAVEQFAEEVIARVR